MKIQEFKDKIFQILPSAQFEEDNYGQIIIYTDLMTSIDGDELVEYTEPIIED